MYRNVFARLILSAFGLLVIFTTFGAVIAEGPYIGADEEGVIVGTTIWLAAIGIFIPIGLLFVWRGLTRRY